MITDLLLFLSQALLWPVLILLFCGVALAAALSGGLLGEALRRRRWKDADQALIASMIADSLRKPTKEELVQALEHRAVDASVLAGDPDLDKLLDDHQLHLNRRLARVNLYVRLGPMLGLAGTLIPLGPGLMALSSGDVEGLSKQLVIAFTSTVLGLFVGGVCFTIHAVRRHWYAKELSDLEFLLGRWKG